MQPTNTQNTFDYSALNQPIGWHDFYLELKNNTSNNIMTLVVIMFMIVIILPTFFGSILATIIGFFFSFPYIVFWTIPMLLFSAVGLYGGIYGFKYAYAKKIKMQNFANSNNVEYLNQIINPSYLGMIFSNGDYKVINEGYRFPSLNNVEIGNFSYSLAGSSNSSDKKQYFGYIKIALSRKLPHMLLDSVSNNLMGQMTNLPTSLKGDQKLSLEGNFDTYFTLYAPKEYEADALYIFTPDVMQTLINHASNYDIEIIGNELYIYGNGMFLLDTEQEVQKLLNLTQVVSKDLLKQSNNYADDRVGNRSLNVVSPQGNKLHTKMPLATITFIVVFMLFNLGFLILFILTK